VTDDEAKLAAGFAASVLILLVTCVILALRILGAVQSGRGMQRLRLLAEQILAAGRGDSEGLRVHLGNLRLSMERRSAELAAAIAREQAEARVLLETRLRDMAERQARHLADIHRSVNETLHEAVEKQMQTSFTRVIEQFAAIQQALGDVQAVAAQVGDLRRVFASPRHRGAWGETQLRAVLDDVLPDGYVANARLRDAGGEVVEFAVRMPMRGGPPLLLAIDCKFPLSDYERLMDAAEAADATAERAARRALEATLRLEARRIAGKYIVPPATVEFAIMYLPSDSLYAEAARIPGLIDELGRSQRIMVMGPSLLPALLRTIQLGAVTLALEQKAAAIVQLLGATKQEMLTMDAVLERLAKNAGAMANSIEDARRRTRVVRSKLGGIAELDAAVSGELLELQASE
jgi:DNA recombination protein RmuC